MKRILFLGDAGTDRAKRIAAVFKEDENVKADFAGVSDYSDVALTRDQVQDSDIIFTMEEREMDFIGVRWPGLAALKTIINLNMVNNPSDKDISKVISEIVLPNLR